MMNLTKTRRLANPDLSQETTHYSSDVVVIAEESSSSCIKQIRTENMVVTAGALCLKPPWLF